MKIQIDDTVRDATPQEEQNILATQQAMAQQDEAAEARLAQRQSARNKLLALGLTNDEVSALLGD